MINVMQMKMARAVLGWSQHDLAKASGVAPTAIARMGQSPKNANATMKTLRKIEIVLTEKGLIFSDSRDTYSVEVPKGL